MRLPFEEYCNIDDFNAACEADSVIKNAKRKILEWRETEEKRKNEIEEEVREVLEKRRQLVDEAKRLERRAAALQRSKRFRRGPERALNLQINLRKSVIRRNFLRAARRKIGVMIGKKLKYTLSIKPKNEMGPHIEEPLETT